MLYGPDKTLSRPHLARGPYFVHPWLIMCFLNNQNKNERKFAIASSLHELLLLSLLLSVHSSPKASNIDLLKVVGNVQTGGKQTTEQPSASSY